MLSFISQGGSVLTSPWFLIIMGVILALILIYVLLILLYRRKQKRLRGVCASIGICKKKKGPNWVPSFFTQNCWQDCPTRNPHPERDA